MITALALAPVSTQLSNCFLSHLHGCIASGSMDGINFWLHSCFITPINAYVRLSHHALVGDYTPNSLVSTLILTPFAYRPSVLEPSPEAASVCTFQITMHLSHACMLGS